MNHVVTTVTLGIDDLAVVQHHHRGARHLLAEQLLLHESVDIVALLLAGAIGAGGRDSRQAVDRHAFGLAATAATARDQQAGDDHCAQTSPRLTGWCEGARCAAQGVDKLMNGSL